MRIEEDKALEKLDPVLESHTQVNKHGLHIYCVFSVSYMKIRCTA